MSKSSFFVLASAVILPFSGAMAADAIMPMDPVALETGTYDWSGFFVGAQVGYADTDTENSFVNGQISPEGVYGGGFAGYNYQMGNFVLGIEGEYNAANIDDTSMVSMFTRQDVEIDSFGSVSGKVGYAIDRFMVYGLGGVSFAHVEASQTGIGFLEGLGTSGSDENYVGYTVGAGVDYAFTDKIFAGLKYQYYDFGSEGFEASGQVFGARTIDIEMHSIAIRAGYKF